MVRGLKNQVLLLLKHYSLTKYFNLMVRRPVLKFTTSRLFLQIISSEAFRPLRSSSKSFSERTTTPITFVFCLKYPAKVQSQFFFKNCVSLIYCKWGLLFFMRISDISSSQFNLVTLISQYTVSQKSQPITKKFQRFWLIPWSTRLCWLMKFRSR